MTKKELEKSISREMINKHGHRPDITWVEKLKTLTYPTGYKEKIGKVIINAGNLKSTTFVLVVDMKGNWNLTPIVQ